MSERIEWLDDGTAGGSPFSPRFGDRYRSSLNAGLTQAREVFLHGCGLPQGWQNQPQWTILETGFGLGLNFLVTWAAWRADPQRPALLHFVSTEAFMASADDVLRSALPHAKLLPLAQQLQSQLWGLLPGWQRLSFAEGRVLLTLGVGDAKTMLRTQALQADSVYLDGFNPQCNPDIWDLASMKAVASCCRVGSRVASWTVARSVRNTLAQCGFVVRKVPGAAPKRDNLQGEFNPAWRLKKSSSVQQRQLASHCIVIGAGLAGAAVAASLARRNWQVQVLELGSTSAAGASGLPAGLMMPHVSPDDNWLSQLTRSGIRLTLQQAASQLQAGSDWSHSGVLEHGISRQRQMPASWQHELLAASASWSQAASPAQLTQAGLVAQAPALWHVQAGWIKPKRLVQAWLARPGVQLCCQTNVASLQQSPDGQWQALDDAGRLLAQAPLVILAAGYASAELAQAAHTPNHKKTLSLQAIRGQISFGALNAGLQQQLPDLPISGLGSLLGAVPMAQGYHWIVGSSFDRDNTKPEIRHSDNIENFQRLCSLAPRAAQALAGDFAAGTVQAWAGVRCTRARRLPVVGPLCPGLWVCSGLGARGLSFAALCAELLAARLHNEPLPITLRLADALMP